MLYLEDYLEMIEHLPQELRDRFTEMREMDLQVHNAMDNLEDQAKQFFSNAKRMKVEQRDVEFEKIKQEYYKILEEAEEKVNLANQIYELVERYLKRLDQELQKFKIELEADNSGITEILEKRSYELDNPTQPVTNHVREKRKYTFHNSSNASMNNSSYLSGVHGVHGVHGMHGMHGVHGVHGFAHHHHDRQLPTSSDKVFTTIPQDALNQNMASASASTSCASGVISSSNITNSRLSCNSFTPLLAVVSANNNVNDRVSGSSSPFIPYRLGNNAIAAAASQAIAATQQMQQGRRTASLKASYEAINSGLQMCGLASMRDAMTFDSSISSSSHQHDMSSHSFPSTSTPATAMGFDISRTSSSARMNKKSRTSSQFGDGSSNLTLHNSLYDDDSSEAIMPGENNGPTPDWSFDPNEPRYCICNQVSYGDMVACDNEDCEKEWFHYGCVGISQPPKGKWFCPDCSDKLNKRKRKERS